MPTELIVEASSSHGGDRGWMLKLIESAALVAADFIKFQSWQVRHLQKSDPQYDWFRQSELTNADHHWLVKACSKVGVSFLTTVYTKDRVEFLHDLGLHAIKIGSGEGGQIDLLEEVAKFPWHVYLSTGLWTEGDMDRALAIFAHHDLTLLHTVSEYPCPLAKANLGRMHWLRASTGRLTGYSDHTIGKEAALAAIALGADVLEVHHSLPGAPRRKPWDKDLLMLRRISEFRRSFDLLMTPGPLVQAPSVDRPFIGRWQHA